jgi:hypothetical protein
MVLSGNARQLAGFGRFLRLGTCGRGNLHAK